MCASPLPGPTPVIPTIHYPPSTQNGFISHQAPSNGDVPHPVSRNDKRHSHRRHDDRGDRYRRS